MAVGRSLLMKYSLGAWLGPVLGEFGQVVLFDISWWL